VLPLLLLLALPATAQQDVWFKQKVKIPFALQYKSEVVKPDEYLITIKTIEGGDKLLTLTSAKGEEVLRTRGEYGKVPPQDRNPKWQVDQGKLSITRVSDEKTPEKKWIVFNLDMKVIGGDFVRLMFKVPEAPAEAP